ncbi:SigE family RNA polymerase sigma factor [Streptomyces reniochalinae]|uniref:SigE family RNA polymerase sigma factor n=1 Tax=Streptomyces reniochalinae TaxID=2250578 RepID=A0A367E7C8_9ACTN|nr:SigE family RNA polymerase sigma factor [Streptomyces reniochalinae]RCG13659.1 SigE family RNA polymerase sigma factor [Streptomyces reniochalinae]
MAAVSTCGGAVPRGWWRWLLARLSEEQKGTDPEGRQFGTASEEIDMLYRHRRLDLVRLAALLVDDIPTAEDVVQEAFAALYRRHGNTLDNIADPEAYVRRSVINASRDVLRRRRTVRAYIPPRLLPAPPPEEEILLKEEHQEVLRALRLLTVRQREVLVLRYWSNMSEADIAATLGLSRGAVKSTASRALTALARRLKETP